jgi:peptide-methionine (R)-S-oxide reductase
MSIFGNNILGKNIFGNKDAGPAPESPAAEPSVQKTDAEWRQELTPEEYHVLRQAGTERPFTGEYWDTHTAGVYQCRACGAELFTSNEKFDSHCGWPSFFAPLAEGTVRYIHDRTLGMERVEVRCATCDSHLGHVFDGEGYPTPTDQRYCINSVSLKLVPREEPQTGATTTEA